MSVVTLGVDVGTTKITCVALDVQSHKIIATHTVANDSEITAPLDKKRGRSEYSPQDIVAKACCCLRTVMEQLRKSSQTVIGLAVTGQQHGVVIVDQDNTPVTPLINWLDQRGEEVFEDTNRTIVEQAILLTGDDASRRTGCRLATGYMGTTLFWMKVNHQLPTSGVACFITDFLGAVLTGKTPVTDPTMAASSGLVDLPSRQWDQNMIAALGLPGFLFPEIQESGQYLGNLTASAAESTGLPEGLPVYVGLGDNQASFLGSVVNKEQSVLVNIGTGSQVATYTDHFVYSDELQTRPFPRNGYLLVSPSSCGGRSYAMLASFLQEIGRQVLGWETDNPIYDTMNQLAQQVETESDGFYRCSPEGKASESQTNPIFWTDLTPEAFTPAHLIRAMLVEIAETLYQSYRLICKATNVSCCQLVGGGNGLRKNPALHKIVSDRFGMPLMLPFYQEEAARGAAFVAAYGTSSNDTLFADDKIFEIDMPEVLKGPAGNRMPEASWPEP